MWRSYLRRSLNFCRRVLRIDPTVTCRCGKSITVAAEHRGKLIRCKQCGRELRLGSRWHLQPRADAALVALSLGYLVAVLVLTLLLWWLGDAWWPATILLFMGRWIFLLPLTVLVPMALVYRRAMLVPLVLATLACVGPLMGGRLGWRRLLSHAAGTPVRVMTFNADGGDVLATELPDVLKELHPDFVALRSAGRASRTPWIASPDGFIITCERSVS